MKNYITYKEFYERVAFDLRDKFEVFDSGENDNSKMFPFENGKWITSECIKELLIDSKNKRKRVVQYVFESDTDILELPSYIGALFALRPLGREQWTTVSDSSDLNAEFLMIDEDTVKNTKDGGWKKGDVLEMVALVFPDDIVGDDDPVVFPPEHQQLLRLVVLLRMYGRANKDMPETTETLYATCYTRWLNSSSRIVNKKSYPHRGYGLGD